MFMEIAVTALGIGLVVIIGFLVLGQVRQALPVSATVTSVPNSCYGQWLATPCTIDRCINSSTGAAIVGNQSIYNTSTHITCSDINVANGMNSMMTTAFAGLGLVAVGIIVLAAFGLIQVFSQ